MRVWLAACIDSNCEFLGLDIQVVLLDYGCLELMHVYNTQPQCPNKADLQDL